MQSMTGCGRGEAQREGWQATVEIRSVNHRFLDLSLRLPRNLSFLEQPLRKALTAAFRRGHLDVAVTLFNPEKGQTVPSADLAVAAAYSDIARQLARHTCRPDDLTISHLIGLEGVISFREPALDTEFLTGLCLEACGAAAEAARDMRAAEGAAIREDLLTHLNALAALREQIALQAPKVTAAYRELLQKRIEQLLEAPMDPVRLAQETAIFADKAAIDEELARLSSHIAQMRRYLDAETDIGKKIDFLIQEMNREVNTIGSKANDAAIAQMVVDAKSEIEKLREQVQNVE